LEELFKHITNYLATGIEACAALLIALAALEATWNYLILYFIDRHKHETRKDDIRIRLGRWLALSLEFELAADILLTAIAPSWDEIGKLGAIIILRTILNYFLQKEIYEIEGNKRSANQKQIPGQNQDLQN